MIQINDDGNWQLKDLGRFVEPVEINDSEGKLVGLFVPADLHRGKEIAAKLRSEADRDEIRRRAQSKERGLTTKEVLEYLHSLPLPPQNGVPSALNSVTVPE